MLELTLSGSGAGSSPLLTRGMCPSAFACPAVMNCPPVSCLAAQRPHGIRHYRDPHNLPTESHEGCSLHLREGLTLIYRINSGRCGHFGMKGASERGRRKVTEATT